MASEARLRDRIDVRPHFTRHDAIRLNTRFADTDAGTMIARVVAEDLLGKTAVVSSFGAESAVLLHLIAAVDRTIPVLFLDTGKHFAETLAYRDTLADRLGIAVETLVPDPETLAAKDDTGLRWSYDPDGCCEIRKVKPLAIALSGFAATFTGRKGFQAATRQGLPRFEIDTSDDAGRIKVNPLASWTKADLDTYFTRHDLPRHPLEAEGYPSIGCAPCTSKVRPGEDPRAGRWRGWDKVECGIHVPDKPGEEPAF